MLLDNDSILHGIIPKKTSSHESLFLFETCYLFYQEVFLKALGRYLFTPSLVLLEPTFSSTSLPAFSSAFRTISFEISLSDTPDELNVYLIPQTKVSAAPLPSSRMVALPYLPVIVSTPSTGFVAPVAASAKQLPFWRLVLMLVFSPSAKVKASDTCARAI